MEQRMQNWTKAGPCTTTSHSSDGSERTHERGLDFGAAEAPPRPPLGQAKGTELGDTLEPQPRASEQSQAANYPRHT